MTSRWHDNACRSFLLPNDDDDDDNDDNDDDTAHVDERPNATTPTPVAAIDDPLSISISSLDGGTTSGGKIKNDANFSA